jgi:hypothetical protein
LILVSRHPRTRRETGLLIGLLFATVLSLSGLAVLGIEALSVTRAYTAVASAWSLSQNDAAFHLTQYAASHDPGDYADFLQAAERPAHALVALAELASPDPNPLVARAAFHESGVDDRDADEILRSARIVRALGLTETFLARRVALDTELKELGQLGTLLHGQIMSSDPSPARMKLILSRIHDVKHRVNRLEADFAADVARVSRRVKTIALASIGLSALVVLGLGALLTLEAVDRIRSPRRVRERETSDPRPTESPPLRRA